MISGESFQVDTHDVIVRHMRFRRGNTHVWYREDSFVVLFGFIQFSFNDAYQKFFLAQFAVINLLVPCKKGFDALEKFLGYLKC